MNILTIDPGASGGLALWDSYDKTIALYKMPDGMTEQVALIEELGKGAKAYIEKVGTYVPGNSATAAVKFARHCGHLEAALYCFGIPSAQVAPGVWMKVLGRLPKKKSERKSAIKERLQRMYPYLKLTLSTSDALGMMRWALSEEGKL